MDGDEDGGILGMAGWSEGIKDAGESGVCQAGGASAEAPFHDPRRLLTSKGGSSG